MDRIESNHESKHSISKKETSSESEHSVNLSEISNLLKNIPMAKSFYLNKSQMSQMPQMSQISSLEKTKAVELNSIFESAFNTSITYHNKIKDFQNKELSLLRKRIEKYRNDLKDLTLSKTSYKEKCQYLIFREKMKLAPKGITNEHIKGIKCTLCQKEDIYGYRYSCEQCKKFDVCEKCISYVALHHNKEHLFYMSNKPHYQTNLYLNTDKDLNSELTLIGEDSYKYEYKKVPSNQTIEIKIKNNGKIKYKPSVNLRTVEGNEPLVIIPQLNPGEEVKKAFTIEMDKLEIGHYEKEIRIGDDNGFFGNPLYIKIEIVECIN